MNLTKLADALCLLTMLGNGVHAAPLSTVFTYQGRLNSGDAPATGVYDFQFMVYDAPAAGKSVGPVLTTNSVSVSNGLFAVWLDFGSGVFTGDARWLGIGVRTNGDASFSVLSPRQSLTAATYALFAANAAVAANVPATALPGNVAYLDANETFTGGISFWRK